MSIRSSPVSLVLPDLKGKSYAVNIVDTPGHVDFSDEASAALRQADGAVLCVDVVEGVMIHTERLIRHLVAEQIPITVCITKIDRLALELKLPPVHAYFKLKHTIEEINQLISNFSGGRTDLRVSPELGNVCFSCATFGASFTLQSIAQTYSDEFGTAMQSNASLGV